MESATRPIVFLFITICVIFHSSPVAAYEKYCVAQSDIEDIKEFHPEGEVDADPFFSLIKSFDSDDELFFGSSNNVYKVFPCNFTERWHVTISSVRKPDQVVTCEILTPASREMLICQNHISVIEKWNNSQSEWLVCGSNSITPNCWRCVDPEDWTCTSIGNFDLAERVIASRPFYHASWLSTNNGVAFAATERGSSEAIYFAKLNVDDFTRNPGTFTHTTNNNYDNWLNRPAFVGSPITYEGYVYFFFRETGTEYINAGKIIYPRVGRICENDQGSTIPNTQNYFRTFLKARLNCSIASPFPFYFDEIQDVYQSTTNNTIVYAVFTTPSEGPPASAVCAYSLEEIHQIFNDATYKGQQQRGFKWLEKTHGQLGSSGNHFGMCDVDYNNPPSVDNLLAYKSYVLIDQLIPNLRRFKDAQLPSNHISDSPLLYCNNYRFTSIAVDDKYEPAIFMIGTNNMSIIKAFYNPLKNDVYGTVVSEIMLNGTESDEETMNEVKDMIVYPRSSPTHVIVTAVSGAFKVPLKYCYIYKTCELCVRARDPHCYWDSTHCVEQIPNDMYVNVKEKCYISSKSEGLDIVVPLQSQSYSTNKSHVVNFYSMVLGRKGCNLKLNVSGQNSNWVIHEDSGSSSDLQSDIEYVTVRLTIEDPQNEMNITIAVSSDCRNFGNCKDASDVIELSTSLVPDDTVPQNNEDQIWKYDCELAVYMYEVFQQRQMILKNCSSANVYTCPPLRYQEDKEICPATY